jgi:hypothetical protein
MSRRCTLTISCLLICLAVTSACGSLPAGTGDSNNPTATARESLPELRASYQDLAAQLDTASCHFMAVVASSSSSTEALRLAATDMASASNWVTNHLAVLPWPAQLQAKSQKLIRAIAAVEEELRAASNGTTKHAVTKHIHEARQLLARIPLAGSQLRTDLHLADRSKCDDGTLGAQ